MNKPVLFISDLHLCDQRPDLTRAFLAFIEQKAIHAESLYILGDLFEFWLGDDDDAKTSITVKAALKHLTQNHIDVFFVHGNRDFLVGKRFAQETGCTLLHDDTVIELCQTQTLIMHGDTLCTDDVKYLEFRRKVRHPLTQLIFKLLPLSVRKKIFFKVKHDSKTSQQQKTAMIMDVTPVAVAEAMQKNIATRLIHGHTHRPAIHPASTLCGERIVLGDWDKLGWYAQADHSGIQLHSFPIEPI